MLLLKRIGFLLLLLTVSIQLSCQNSNVVYVTKSGTKYHKAECVCLSKSKIETTLNVACEKGYEPCSNCEPKPAKTDALTASDTANSGIRTVKQTGTLTQCTAKTKAGTQCKRNTSDPSGKCYQHK